MFIIIVYDANVKRVGKLLKIGRKYLNWVQNSVFEGEISQAKFKMLKDEMKKKIKEDDSIIFYVLRDTKYSTREILGKDKNPIEMFI